MTILLSRHGGDCTHLLHLLSIKTKLIKVFSRFGYLNWSFLVFSFIQKLLLLYQCRIPHLNFLNISWICTGLMLLCSSSFSRWQDACIQIPSVNYWLSRFPNSSSPASLTCTFVWSAPASFAGHYYDSCSGSLHCSRYCWMRHPLATP